MTKIETRSMEVRAVDDEKEMLLEGYAVVFDSETRLYDDIYEEVATGAFNGVDFSDVRAFYDHQTGNLLGRTKSGTLSLNVDEKGLRFSLKLPNTQLGRDIFELTKRGDLSQCSFGFTVAEDVWTYREDDTYHRSITKIGNLVEVSLVSIPAYDDTSVAVAQRSRDQFKNKQRALELELELLGLAEKS